jgi:acetoacetate decarboxylase
MPNGALSILDFTEAFLEPRPDSQSLLDAGGEPELFAASGFGDYTESGVVIPCSFNGTPASFMPQMYLDDDPPIAAGREIRGFPKKLASPKLELVKDTLTGTLDYAGQRSCSAC